MFAVLKKLLRDQNGATAIEYALVASLVSVAAISFIASIRVPNNGHPLFSCCMERAATKTIWRHSGR